MIRNKNSFYAVHFARELTEHPKTMLCGGLNAHVECTYSVRLLNHAKSTHTRFHFNQTKPSKCEYTLRKALNWVMGGVKWDAHLKNKKGLCEWGIARLIKMMHVQAI